MESHKKNLTQALVKYRSRDIGCYDNRTALKFDRHLGSAAAKVPVKTQSDCKRFNTKLTALRLHGILQYDIRPHLQWRPWLSHNSEKGLRLDLQCKKLGYNILLSFAQPVFLCGLQDRHFYTTELGIGYIIQFRYKNVWMFTNSLIGL